MTEDLEASRFQSDIARLRAEEAKFLAEAQEIEKRNRSTVFTPKILLQSLVAGLVAAGLLVAWGIGYLKPILERNQELSRIENKILSAENRQQKVRNNEQKISLALLKKALGQDLDQLQEENKKLQSQIDDSKTLSTTLKSRMEDLSRQYEQLSREKVLTASEKNQFEILAVEAQMEVANLRNELGELALAQDQAQANSRSISDQRLTTWLAGSQWAIREEDWDPPNHDLSLLPGGKVDWISAKTDAGRNAEHSWAVDNGTLTIKINNGFVTFVSTVDGSTPETLTGTIRNKPGKSSSWTGELVSRS